jgi:hypothetical protein
MLVEACQGSISATAASADAPPLSEQQPYVNDYVNLKPLLRAHRVNCITLVPASADIAARCPGATVAHVVLARDVLAPGEQHTQLESAVCTRRPLSFDTMEEAATRFMVEHAAAHHEKTARKAAFEEFKAAVERGEKPQEALYCRNNSDDEMFGDGDVTCACFACTYDYEAEEAAWPRAAEFAHPAPALPSHVQLVLVPRFKQSRASGNEWRHHVCALHTLPQEDVVVAMSVEKRDEMRAYGVDTSVHDAEIAATLAPVAAPRPRRALLYRSMAEALACVYRDAEALDMRESGAWGMGPEPVRFDPTAQATFSERACMQPGCNKRCDALFKVLAECRPEDGSLYEGTATRHTGAHRVFCSEHAQRGDQHAEDHDANYALVWQRDGVTLVQREQGHTVRTIIMGS